MGESSFFLIFVLFIIIIFFSKFIQGTNKNPSFWDNDSGSSSSDDFSHINHFHSSSDNYKSVEYDSDPWFRKDNDGLSSDSSSYDSSSYDSSNYDSSNYDSSSSDSSSSDSSSSDSSSGSSD